MLDMSTQSSFSLMRSSANPELSCSPWRQDRSLLRYYLDLRVWQTSPVRILLLQPLELVQHHLQRPVADELYVLPSDDLTEGFADQKSHAMQGQR
jgi:hypothetical protein